MIFLWIRLSNQILAVQFVPLVIFESNWQRHLANTLDYIRIHSFMQTIANTTNLNRSILNRTSLYAAYSHMPELRKHTIHRRKTDDTSHEPPRRPWIPRKQVKVTITLHTNTQTHRRLASGCQSSAAFSSAASLHHNGPFFQPFGHDHIGSPAFVCSCVCLDSKRWISVSELLAVFVVFCVIVGGWQ